MREGLTFCLSLPLDVAVGGSAERFAPRLFATGGHDHPRMNHAMEGFYPGATDILCDDAVTMTLQYSTQWDALSHMGYRFDADGDGVAEICYYNGWKGGTDVCDHENGGAKRLSIDRPAAHGLQSRGVLIDFVRHFGPERKAVNHADLMRILDTDGIVIQRGDILCLHSGFADALLGMEGKVDHKALRGLGAELDGGDNALLNWLNSSGVAAIAADTVAVETFRRPDAQNPRPLMPLHEHCLFKLGMPLAEYWHLTPLAHALADRGRHAFLLTAPPLRLPRAVGSPVTPVATI